MKFQLKAALVLILLLASAVPLMNTVTQDAQASATVLYVGPTATYQKIQDAINASSDYGVIYLDNGVYHENLDFNTLPGFNSLTFIGNGSVTINGTTGLCFNVNGAKLQQLHLYNLSTSSL